MSNPNNNWKNYGGRPPTPPLQLLEILLLDSKNNKGNETPATHFPIIENISHVPEVSSIKLKNTK